MNCYCTVGKLFFFQFLPVHRFEAFLIHSFFHLLSLFLSLCLPFFELLRCQDGFHFGFSLLHFLFSVLTHHFSHILVLLHHDFIFSPAFFVKGSQLIHLRGVQLQFFLHFCKMLLSFGLFLFQHFCFFLRSHRCFLCHGESSHCQQYHC